MAPQVFLGEARTLQIEYLQEALPEFLVEAWIRHGTEKVMQASVVEAQTQLERVMQVLLVSLAEARSLHGSRPKASLGSSGELRIQGFFHTLPLQHLAQVCLEEGRAQKALPEFLVAQWFRPGLYGAGQVSVAEPEVPVLLLAQLVLSVGQHVLERWPY